MCFFYWHHGGTACFVFPDVSETLTGGETREQCLELAEDALAVILSDYVRQNLDIPSPGTASKGQELIPLQSVVAAKLALYSAMTAQKITKVALADRLGITESVVRKLCNPDYKSSVGQVETALKALGRILVIENKAA